MTYLDMADPEPDGSLREKPGRVTLAGGEILLKQVREPILYPAMQMLHEKYHSTAAWKSPFKPPATCDEQIVEELLERHVGRIVVSGLDEYHDGIEPERRANG